MTFKKTLPLLAGLLSSVPALAVDFDFTTLSPGAGTSFTCTTSDRCSSNNNQGAGGAFTFDIAGAIDITSASGSYYTGGQWRTATAIQDYNGTEAVPWVGLGVYNAGSGVTFSDTSDDNITTNEKLTIVFNQAVTLTGLSLRAEGHGLFSNSSTNTFLLNGGQQFLRGSLTGLSLTGTTFTFEFGGGLPDQYYLSGMTAVAAIPEPGTYALMLAGLGAIGFMARRRRQD